MAHGFAVATFQFFGERSGYAGTPSKASFYRVAQGGPAVGQFINSFYKNPFRKNPCNADGTVERVTSQQCYCFKVWVAPGNFKTIQRGGGFAPNLFGWFQRPPGPPRPPGLLLLPLKGSLFDSVIENRSFSVSGRPREPLNHSKRWGDRQSATYARAMLITAAI